MTSFATASDGVRLHVEDTSDGTPIIFVHEFGGDQRSWEPQVRFFSRRYRCVTFNARGYPPSDVPEDVAQYSQARAVDDIRDVLDHLEIARAHIVGLSMGGFATLHFGMTYPDRALSLVVAGAGYGAEKELEEQFREVSREVASGFETQGSEVFSRTYAMAAPRIPYLVKDPRGWGEFRRMLGEHSSTGAANTMRGVQAGRPSLYDLEDALRAMSVPTLIVTGDEDDHCLQPGLYLKRVVPKSGLLVIPKTGHTLNLEEPALFNRSVAEFLAMVEEGRWLARDQRSQPSEIMKTK
ncbi:MAG: alpha/beta hydrolase [Gammaproteobacteria bacterium]|nr:alpha/beta hydrolase [Gammaproteobacteria bacterium]MDH3505868.1 alpha/beta hydrolase [Gammaproteobacteria bacterium]